MLLQFMRVCRDSWSSPCWCCENDYSVQRWSFSVWELGMMVKIFTQQWQTLDGTSSVRDSAVWYVWKYGNVTLVSWWCATKVDIFKMVFLGHVSCMQCIICCDLLLQMLHIAWSVCVSVCVSICICVLVIWMWSIEMPFDGLSFVGPGYYALDNIKISPW